jgi:hypothetical protein
VIGRLNYLQVEDSEVCNSLRNVSKNKIKGYFGRWVDRYVIKQTEQNVNKYRI